MIDELFIVTANRRMVPIFLSNYIEVFIKSKINRSKIKVVQCIDDCRGRSFYKSAIVTLEDYYDLKNVGEIIEFFEARNIKIHELNTQNKDFDKLKSILEIKA